VALSIACRRRRAGLDNAALHENDRRLIVAAVRRRLFSDSTMNALGTSAYPKILSARSTRVESDTFDDVDAMRGRMPLAVSEFEQVE